MLNNEIKKEKDRVRLWIWLIPFLAPLLTLFFSYVLQPWSWGLMDDLQILTAGEGIMDRFSAYFSGLCHWGVFRPTFVIHSAILYTIFENNPNVFYIFRLVEVLIVLLIWGCAAYRITRRKVSLFLLPTITLSFHYFYDAFFYLSSQETIGLLFLGIALHFFLNSIPFIVRRSLGEPLTHKAEFNWFHWFMGLFFILVAFGAKEPFVSSGIAMGIAYLYLAWQQRSTKHMKSILIAGILLLVMSFVYAFFVTHFIKSGYTSSYALSFPKLIGNLEAWAKKDLLNHFPWIFGAGFFFYLAYKAKVVEKVLNAVKFGLVLGVFLYLGFLGILLPWNTITYYATPFGIFFAFIIVMIISSYLEKINMRWQLFAVIGAFILNQFMCQYALEREGTYQRDTIHFMQWLKVNKSFESYNNNILCDAMEAAAAIPGHINRKERLNIKNFQWSSNPDELIDGKKAKFYLHTPRFSGEVGNKFNGWNVLFLSKNWTLYARPEEK